MFATVTATWPGIALHSQDRTARQQEQTLVLVATARDTAKQIVRRPTPVSKAPEKERDMEARTGQREEAKEQEARTGQKVEAKEKGMEKEEVGANAEEVCMS